MRSRFAFVLLLSACGPKVSAEPPETRTPAPTAEPSPAPAPPLVERPAEAPAATPTTEPPIGILACDEYLARYRDCEPQLEPEIQAGDRRAYRAERGWIEYMRDSPEGPGLAEACREMANELNQICPD